MKSLRNPSLPPRQRQIQFHAYNVLSRPMEAVQAMFDPRLVGLFRRILRGGQDCAICQTCLNLDPDSAGSPGLIGYLHGDLHHRDGDIDAIGVAACCGCVRKLGDELAAKTLCHEFADTCCGGGTVQLVQGGVS